MTYIDVGNPRGTYTTAGRGYYDARCYSFAVNDMHAAAVIRTANCGRRTRRAESSKTAA